MSNSLKTAAIVEARMTSSRLPGKHLYLVNQEPIICHLINRLKSISMIDEVILAITENKADDVLEELAINQGIKYYRGSEDDVLKRVLESAEEFNVDIICEVTGDCPIIDPNLIEQAIENFNYNDCSYLNNGRNGLPDGMGCQVFYTKILKDSEAKTSDPLDREHVTLHIKRNPKMYPAIYLIPEKKLSRPAYEVTLDEISDYELLKEIIENFGPDNKLFSCKEVIDFLDSNPNLLEINSHVKRTT